jgi:hypothetical protein
MIVHGVTLERPQADRPTVYAMARVETDCGMFVFAAMLSGRINVASFRFNNGWHQAFELPHEDALVCHGAIRREIDNERAREYAGGAA